jgi:Tol biopolymer transport system component
MNKPTFQFLAKVLSCVILMAGCTPQPQNLDIASPTSNIDLTSSTSTASLPTEAATLQLPKLQLTYSIGSSIYGIDVSYLDAPEPCLSDSKLLFSESSGFGGAFFWSPDGQKVSYEFENDVFVSDWNGQNKIKISTSPDYDGWPVWTPDSQHIVYETKDQDAYFIFVMSNQEGTSQETFLTEKVLDRKGNLSSPERLSWSPDGKKIVFRANSPKAKDGTLYQIFVYSVEKEEIKQITNADADSFTPSFSSDGEWIILTRDKDKTNSDDSNTLIKISLRTGDETMVFAAEGDWTNSIWLPQWSPVGDWISFVMDGDIYLIRPDGTKLMNVTQSPNLDENVAVWRLASKP